MSASTFKIWYTLVIQRIEQIITKIMWFNQQITLFDRALAHVENLNNIYVNKAFSFEGSNVNKAK